MRGSFVVFDIETTGLYPTRDKVIEIGALRVVDGEIRDKFSSLINPKISLPAKIVELTGIQDEMLQDAPNTDCVMNDFLSFIGEDVLMGHNVIFDYSFLKVYWSRMGKPFEKKGIDTLKIAKILHAELESRSLENLCKYYRIPQERAHRAFEDAQNTFFLYEKMWEEGNESRPDLFVPLDLFYHMKKEQPATEKQKKYLLDLLKYHRIKSERNTFTVFNYEQSVEDLTRSEASRMIDSILSDKGRA